MLPNTAHDTGTTLIAAGSVTGASGVAPIAGGVSPKLRGIAASGIVRSSPGTYVITLPVDNRVPFTNGVAHFIAVTLAGSTTVPYLVSWTALGVITVQWLDLNAGGAPPVDTDFIFDIWRYA